MGAVQISTAEIIEIVPGVTDARASQVIAGTIGRASLFAPCILSDTFDAVKSAAAKDILIECIVRALEAGTGAVSNYIAGPYQGTMDTSKPRRRRFTRDEISDLKQLCGLRPGGAFTITLTNDDADAGVEDATVTE